jgi:SnoaL-like domain
MSTDPRQTIAAVIDIWNGQPTDRLPPLLTPGYRGHMLGVANGERGDAGYAAAIERYRDANPGVVFSIVDQFNAGDRWVSRLEAHRPAAGEIAESICDGINISRLAPDGRLAEEWAIWSPWRAVAG